MTDKLKKLLENNGFCTAAVSQLEKTEKTMSDMPEWQEMNAVSPAAADRTYMNAQKHLADKAGVSVFLLQMLHIVLHLEEIESEMSRRGLSISGLVYDISTKAEETFELYGCYGIHCYDFIAPFFGFRRLSLGRLEYEPMKYRGLPFVCGPAALEPGSDVVGLHIPGGRKLTRESCMDSYRKAFAYFGCSAERPLILHCVSWLLNPDHRAMLDRSCNLLGFLNMFTIMDTIEMEGFPDAWRVWGKDYRQPVQELPEDNAVRRAYKHLLMEQGKTKRGIGLLVFDGQKILTGREQL